MMRISLNHKFKSRFLNKNNQMEKNRFTHTTAEQYYIALELLFINDFCLNELCYES